MGSEWVGSARARARIRSRYRRTRTLLLLAAYLLPAACCSVFLPLSVSSLSLASTLVSAPLKNRKTSVHSPEGKHTYHYALAVHALVLPAVLADVS